MFQEILTQEYKPVDQKIMQLFASENSCNQSVWKNSLLIWENSSPFKTIYCLPGKQLAYQTAVYLLRHSSTLTSLCPPTLTYYATKLAQSKSVFCLEDPKLLEADHITLEISFPCIAFETLLGRLCYAGVCSYFRRANKLSFA